LIRFSLFLLVSFIAWALIPAEKIPVVKLIISTVVAAILTAAVLLDAYLRHRPVWLFPLAARDQRVRISAMQAVIVTLWFAGIYVFVWWFGFADLA